MKRNIDLSEVSDGKLYTSRDLVKVGCQECAGCSACCQGMGASIVLDPLDTFRLTKGLEKSFDELIQRELELNVADGLILPNLRMAGEKEQCIFLNLEGRCSIHPLRPGICRLFPLGRIYEEGSFRYFLQVHECAKTNRTKQKVSRWLDTPRLKEYEKFVADWHYFLLDVQQELEGLSTEEQGKQIALGLLNQFYRKPYDTEADFYEQFYARLEQVR